MAKCLSIRQPWVQLILDGIKDVENRSWQTLYRGPLLIQAGLRVERDLVARYRREAARRGARWPEVLPTGGILGIVNLVDCAERSKSKWHNRGAIGWVLREPMHIPMLSYKGRLGLFDVPDEIILQHLHDNCPEALEVYPSLVTG